MLGGSDCVATIAVSDQEAARKFYEGVLGLEQAMESPGGVFYKSGKTGVFVYPSEYAGSNKATAASWMASDVPAVAEALKAKGVSLEHYPDLPGVTMEGDVHVMGELNAIWFKDPDGNILNVTNEMG
jgi:catechol 2,3-dioxygenase-like lactoylglutathione lyase family enzyme